MAFGIRVFDGRGRLRGVWWQLDSATPPEPLYLDEWEQALADNQLDNARTNFADLAPVPDGDELRPADWLDFLVWKARPSVHVQLEQVEGPFETDTSSAEDLLVWAEEHPEPVPAGRMVQREWTP